MNDPYNNEVTRMPFFRSFYEVLKSLPPEQCKEALCGLCAYVFDGGVPDGLSPIADVFVKMAIPNVDASLDVSRKRSAARTKSPSEDFDKTKSPSENFVKTKITTENFDKTKSPDENFVKTKITTENFDKTKSPSENFVPLGKGKGKGKGDGLKDYRDTGVWDNGVLDKDTGSVCSARERAHTHTREDRPTAQEVAEYASRNGLTIDAQAFVDHYNSVGWQVKGQPIQDWRSRVNIWHRQNAEKKANGPPKSAYMQSIDSRISDIDDWVRRRSKNDKG